MILDLLTLDFEQGAALLYPLRRPPSVSGHQSIDIPDPFAFGNDPGLREYPAA
jgi:hypothetical protein